MRKLPRLNVSYWLLMLMCTTMGELIGNLLSRNFELGYTKGAMIDVLVFSLTILIFLSLKLKNEVFYWILILMGNIGGTNLADWVTLEPLASDKTWGFLKPLELGTQKGSLAVMHPVGATIGNYVSKPIGLNLGNVYTNVALILLFIGVYLADRRGKIDSRQADRPQVVPIR